MHLRRGDGVMLSARVSLSAVMWFHMSCLCHSMHSLRVRQRFETVGRQLLHWRLHLDTETHGSLAATITMTKLSKSVIDTLGATRVTPKGPRPLVLAP